MDEEFGGVNGTLAGRFRNGPMDGAVLGESTDLEIYPASKGLLISNLTFRSDRGCRSSRRRWPGGRTNGPT